MLRVLAESAEQLNLFIERDIKILFSAYPHEVLAINKKTNIPHAVTRFLSLKSFDNDDLSRIIRNGEGYEIKLGGNKICGRDKIVTKCTEGNSVWKIVEKRFGYNIRQGSFCITQGENDMLVLKKCSDTDDQLFTFRFYDMTENCPKLFSSDDAKFNDQYANEPKEKTRSKANIMPTINVFKSESGSSSEDSSSEISEVPENPETAAHHSNPIYQSKPEHRSKPLHHSKPEHHSKPSHHSKKRGQDEHKKSSHHPKNEIHEDSTHAYEIPVFLPQSSEDFANRKHDLRQMNENILSRGIEHTNAFFDF